MIDVFYDMLDAGSYGLVDYQMPVGKGVFEPYCLLRLQPYSSGDCGFVERFPQCPSVAFGLLFQYFLAILIMPVEIRCLIDNP